MRLDRRTQRKYERKLREAEKRGEIRKLKREIKEKEKSYDPPKKKMSASKMYMILMLTIAVEIVVFIEWVTIHTGDTSCLYVLASIPVTTLVPSLLSYFKKSRIENSAGGIVYDAAFRTQDNTEGNTENSDIAYTDDTSNGVG